MSSLDILLALTENFSGDTIALRTQRCLNTRYRAIDCTICADTCPAEEAITVISSRPKIDNKACLHCGLCLHHCPTGAFTCPDSLPGKLIKTVAALPFEPVDLVCTQHPTPNRGPAPQAVQIKRCLAALSPATLLELSTQGREIWLDDTPCADCPLGKIHPALEQTVAEANGWGRLLKNASPLSLRTEPEAAQPTTNRPVYEADRPPISRRGFFGSLKRFREDAAAYEDSDDIPTQSDKIVPVSERLPQFIPTQRAKILSIIEKQTQASDTQAKSKIQNPKSKIGLADVTVDANLCSACGLCARFCPTGALKFLSDDKQFALAFRPSICLGQRCNICLSACPEEAVSIQPATISPELPAEKPRYLAAGELTPCQNCKTPIAAGSGQPVTCFVCRFDPTKANWLKAL